MSPKDLQDYALPIGIVIAALAYVFIAPLRKALTDSFNKGYEAGKDARDSQKD